MMTTHVKDLFSPLRAGRLSLQHRVVMAPLTRMRASGPEGAPDALNAEYYGQRASEGGLIITEATNISLQGKGFPQTPGIYSDSQQAGWKQVVEAVHQKGGAIYLQLWHTGRISHQSHHPETPSIAPSAIRPVGETLDANFTPQPFATPAALELSAIPAVIEEYREAARRAKAAGFDGVELHAANGFLIDQFLQNKTNQRTDEYGGSIANRMRFMREALAALREVYSAGEIGVRLSPFGKLGDIGDSNPMALFTDVATWLSEQQIGYLHLVEPRANTGLNEEQDMTQPASIAALLRPYFDGAIIASGGFTRESANALIAAGNADAVAFGRAFIANPDLPYRLSVNAPLNAYDRSTFYAGDARGYTDYPTLPRH
ncbi:alkene reductase [Cedecea sp. NFIX57]|uniref:alkene reductase n=1 Tax=Cedecea sp. NFIX57 TaxID=1566286 RepID=UPI000A0E89F2|nr:alkene reductase [Cedecea sp. NFIX57]SMG54599.1 N-ethylmaleimide reductase [Cedecea sp. NFIX57]